MVEAKCKVCGNSAPVDQFKLHHEYRQMVCQGCFTGKTGSKKEVKKKEDRPRPPGWDAEDDYLEKISKIKIQENQAQFSKIPGTDQVRCKCSLCKYSFKYDPFRRKPGVCPYCSADIPKLKTFNLL